MGRPLRVCIISNMPPIDRSEKMTLRLTKEEVRLRDDISAKLGISVSGVMRMALRRLGSAEGMISETKKKA